MKRRTDEPHLQQTFVRTCATKDLLDPVSLSVFKLVLRKLLGSFSFFNARSLMPGRSDLSFSFCNIRLGLDARS
jgi:hypothetical protein